MGLKQLLAGMILSTALSAQHDHISLAHQNAGAYIQGQFDAYGSTNIQRVGAFGRVNSWYQFESRNPFFERTSVPGNHLAYGGVGLVMQHDSADTHSEIHLGPTLGTHILMRDVNPQILPTMGFHFFVKHEIRDFLLQVMVTGNYMNAIKEDPSRMLTTQDVKLKYKDWAIEVTGQQQYFGGRSGNAPYYRLAMFNVKKELITNKDLILLGLMGYQHNSRRRFVETIAHTPSGLRLGLELYFEKK